MGYTWQLKFTCELHNHSYIIVRHFVGSKVINNVGHKKTPLFDKLQNKFKNMEIQKVEVMVRNMRKSGEIDVTQRIEQEIVKPQKHPFCVLYFCPYCDKTEPIGKLML